MQGSEMGLDGGDAGHPSRASDAADPADIEALLEILSQLRHTLAADLSAAAGALEDQRPDIASQVLGGARDDLARLREPARQQPVPADVKTREPAAAALVAAGAPGLPAPAALQGGSSASPDQPGDGPAPRRHRSRYGRLAVSAMALGLAVAVLPRLEATSSHTTPRPRSTAATGIQLVSAEFSQLRQVLEAPHPTALSLERVGQSWQQAVESSLPTAATQAALANQVVTLLRQERTLVGLVLINASTPSSLRTAATMLNNNADTLLGQLRALAGARVLSAIPTRITALALPQVTSPDASSPATAPARGGSPAQGGASAVPPASTPTTPMPSNTPPPPVLPLPSGLPLPTAPLPGQPLPIDPGSGLSSLLNQLTGPLTKTAHILGNPLNSARR